MGEESANARTQPACCEITVNAARTARHRRDLIKRCQFYFNVNVTNKKDRKPGLSGFLSGVRGFIYQQKARLYGKAKQLWFVNMKILKSLFLSEPQR